MNALLNIILEVAENAKFANQNISQVQFSNDNDNGCVNITANEVDKDYCMHAVSKERVDWTLPFSKFAITNISQLAKMMSYVEIGNVEVSFLSTGSGDFIKLKYGQKSKTFPVIINNNEFEAPANINLDKVDDYVEFECGPDICSRLSNIECGSFRRFCKVENANNHIVLSYKNETSSVTLELGDTSTALTSTNYCHKLLLEIIKPIPDDGYMMTLLQRGNDSAMAITYSTDLIDYTYMMVGKR